MKHIYFSGLLLLLVVMAFTYSTRIITGTITDDAGKPIIAYITVKETGKSVSSAADGSFRIETDEHAVLVITAGGYEKQELILSKENTLAIRLHASLIMKMDTVLIDRKTFNIGSNGQQLSKVLMGSVASLEVTGQRFGYDKMEAHFYQPTSPERKIISGEGYDHITENPFVTVDANPLSTFSIDVDAASYSNVRRILKTGNLPTEGAVRIEEMINYFDYEYAQPAGNNPFDVHTELAICPWNPQHQLVLIGLQGKKMDATELPPSNLTFLIDVSGSMFSPDKLPLVQSSLKLLTDQLRAQDKVSIVVYAGNAGLVLPPTPGDRKIAIREAIDRLQAGGSTAGGAGIQLAYKVAKENFMREGNNRVILCTDGDFNVGLSSDDALENLIESERKSGVYLTVLGYGTGNYQDSKMQKLADKGNGNHAYIDNIGEAKKVLINEFGGTMYTIAKDVKLQVEFNPSKVKGYRLIGYENRMLAKEDFNNDQKDAGELGSGHTVTALYELIPTGVAMPENNSVDSLRYQPVSNSAVTKHTAYTDEVMMIKLRYKKPDSDQSSLLSYPVKGKPASIETKTDNFRFAAAVASFGMLLRNSEYKGSADYPFTKSLAEKAMGKDKEGYRHEFVQLVDIAALISKGKEVVRREE